MSGFGLPGLQSPFEIDVPVQDDDCGDTAFDGEPHHGDEVVSVPPCDHVTGSFHHDHVHPLHRVVQGPVDPFLPRLFPLDLEQPEES